MASFIKIICSIAAVMALAYAVGRSDGSIEDIGPLASETAGGMIRVNASTRGIGPLASETAGGMIRFT